MEPAVAKNIAYAWHGSQVDHSGGLMVHHLERVAASVPVEARSVAFLHDVLEHTDVPVAALSAEGITVEELAAVQLLTRDPAESFEAHVLGIAHAKGPEGRIARTVKLADIEDHLAHDARARFTHKYGWARMHILAGQHRADRVSAAEPLQSVA